ncbi:endonuclease/exonuclease/phosphatase family protein [Nocardia uniformis]|uniref:endonuclease/exonuclease/phosphatase family protein n=1 Tax=Nocardia uniformis TaxID=53432 RepID=UPI000B0A2351|nr:endonuclease/exonuclease/phosphatase family protein [Nocardia uniformis]
MNSTARTVLCCLVILPAACWALVRLTGSERGPLVQLLAFTPYIAAWSLLPLVLMLVLRRRWLAGIAGLVVVALAWAVLPRAFGTAETGAAGAVALRVLTANMQFGAADPVALVDLVRDQRVDVLALQEYTPEAAAALRTAGLDRELPYAESHPLPKASGSALYSRYPLTDGGVRVNPGQFAQAHAIVTVPGAQPVLVESVHTTPPAHLDNLNYWRTDLASQPNATAPPAGVPRILAGDFNATLDHAPLRDLIARGYRDAAATVGAGFVGTWGPYAGRHGTGRPIPPIAIDRVLADQRIGVGEVSAHSVPHTDHRALAVVLFVPTRP